MNDYWREIGMDERERLDKLLEGTKEDAPVSGKLFSNFLTNHFLHLHEQVSRNTKLLWIILVAIIASAIAGKF